MIVVHSELLCMVSFEIIGVRILTFLYLETNKNGNKILCVFSRFVHSFLKLRARYICPFDLETGMVHIYFGFYHGSTLSSPSLVCAHWLLLQHIATFHLGALTSVRLLSL